jgi:hypothetical protein
MEASYSSFSTHVFQIPSNSHVRVRRSSRHGPPHRKSLHCCRLFLCGGERSHVSVATETGELGSWNFASDDEQNIPDHSYPSLNRCYSTNMHQASRIFVNAIPILAMVGLIPFIENDYSLTLTYIVVILAAFAVKRESNEIRIFIFGFLVMIIFEYLFVSTGVETFVRNSLFGLMPLWLPFLWGYGFVAIKRSVDILNN